MPSPYRFLTTEAVNALGKLPLLARNVVEGFITGLHNSPFHGFSVEFAEHRKYTHGDNIRDLDWTAYARTNRYYIKRYREETNLRCRLIVDASASMGFTSRTMTKLDFACGLAACLAYLALRQRDAVGLSVLDGTDTRTLPSSARPAHLGLLMEMLEAARAGGTAPVTQALNAAAQRLHRRGLVVAMSDLLDDEDTLLKSLRHLRHRRHEVILFHILDPAEEELPFRNVTEFVDLETGERLKADPQAIRARYQEEIAAFRNRCRRMASDCNIDYVAVTTNEPFERLLLRYLMRRSRA